MATTLLETELKDSWRRVIGTERVPPFRQPVRQFILAENQLDPAANDSVRQYLVRHDVRHQMGIPVIIVEFIQGRREMGRLWLKESGSMGRCVSGDDEDPGQFVNNFAGVLQAQQRGQQH